MSCPVENKFSGMVTEVVKVKVRFIVIKSFGHQVNSLNHLACIDIVHLLSVIIVMARCQEAIVIIPVLDTSRNYPSGVQRPSQPGCLSNWSDTIATCVVTQCYRYGEFFGFYNID